MKFNNTNPTDIFPYPKRMKGSPLEGIQDPQCSPVSGNQDQFPVIAELETRPLTRALIGQFKSGKWTLKEEEEDDVSKL